MSKNPIVPYAVLAVLGIVTMIVIASFGIGQREAIQNPDAVEESETIEDPEEIYKNACASCHGDDLSGNSGPELQEVGNRLSEEEIDEIITEGIEPAMPAGLVDPEESAILSEWLAEQQ